MKNKIKYLAVFFLASCMSMFVNEDEVKTAIKQALKIGTERAVATIKQKGFESDMMPSEIKNVASTLKRLGLGSMVTKFENKIADTAVKATPKIADVFKNTVDTMTLTDIMDIYKGKDDAATTYLKKKSDLSIKKAIKPIIADELKSTGAASLYNQIVSRYNQIPFAGKINADLNDVIAEKTKDGIFDYLAKEEKAIRNDPKKRSTNTLKKVFGARDLEKKIK